MSQLGYSKNEIVLCLATFDNEWYKAKILYVKVHNSRSTYKVHYHGWNSSWDEWISEPFRLSKGSKNTTICKQLLQSKREEHRKLFINTNTKSTESSEDSDINEINESNEINVRNCMVCILPLSIEIQTNICNQFKLISEHSILLIQLPKPKHKTINYICNQFIESEQNKIRKDNKINPIEEIAFCNEIINSVRTFFNAFIGVHLLFNIEKQQHIQLMRHYGNKNSNNKNIQIDCCDIYGIEHLFRLIWKLPNIYKNVKGLNAMQAAKVSNYISLFNGYITKYIDKYSVEFDMHKNPQNIGLILLKK